MFLQLKKSAKSSNFWTDIATIVSAFLIAITASYSDPEVAADVSLKQVIITAVFKAANILHHFNKDNKYVDITTDPTPMG